MFSVFSDHLCNFQVERCGQFDVLTIAFYHRDFDTEALDNRCIVGETVAVRLAESPVGEGYIKHLRRLYRSEKRAVYRESFTRFCIDLSEGIDSRYHRNSRTAGPCLIETSADDIDRYERSHAIVYGNQALCIVGNMGKAVL